MNIHITIVTYALDITPLVDAIHGDGIYWHIFTHHERMHEMGCMIQDVYPNVHDYFYVDNRGLARSWNEGLIAAQDMGADVLMIANDDIVASRADVECIAEKAMANRQCYLVTSYGYDESIRQKADLRFALCAINPIALETIGYFDQTFCPIHFEDTDWQRRAELAGLGWYRTNTNLRHIGSATRNLSPANYAEFEQTYPLNQAYYEQKWGGVPGQERYTVPFNNPAFGLKIDREHIHAPYEGYNRA